MERRNLRWYSSSSSASLLLILFFFFELTGISASISVSTSISDGVFASFGRNLLQTKKACPVNFEFRNYTIITSQCKGPPYLPTPCCAALAQFACPYADELNDLTNDCASTMFSYINLYGKYPPGLFARECRGGKQGLPCPDTQCALIISNDGWS